MEKITSVINRAIAIIISVTVTLTGLSIGNNFIIEQKEKAVFSAALIADVHLTDELYRRAVFLPGLEDISRHVKPDLFILAGDCTDNGNDANWKALSGMLDRYLNVDEKIIALGNHDTWETYSDGHGYKQAVANYIKYSNEIMGTDFKKVYFTRKLFGYTFIVMASESDTTGATISDKQLSWLDSQLKKAASSSKGKPVFVINHQPMNYTHGAGKNEHGNGFESDRASKKLKSILDKYKNIIYISGHQHRNLDADGNGEAEGFMTVEKVGKNITSVNLPSYEYGTFLVDGTGFLGQGMVMYVYEDKIEFAGRNFALSNWDKDFSVTVKLK